MLANLPFIHNLQVSKAAAASICSGCRAPGVCHLRNCDAWHVVPSRAWWAIKRLRRDRRRLAALAGASAQRRCGGGSAGGAAGGGWRFRRHGYACALLNLPSGGGRQQRGTQQHASRLRWWL